MTEGICLAPWRAISIKPNGDVAPDAQYEGIFGNIHTTPFVEILKSDAVKDLKTSFLQGAVANACRSCRKKEESLGHSRRIFFDHTFRFFKQEVDFSDIEGQDIWYLDLTLSNKCNLKCRMCNGISSTSWLAEERALLSKPSRLYHRPPNAKAVKIELDDVLKIFSSPEPFRNLKYLALRGGEPLLEEENLKVLEQFIDWGLASKISLDISTNGSVLSPRILNALEKFEKVDFYISVEGVGSLYNYIRGGDKFSLKQLEEHIIQFRSIPNVTLMFAVTVSVYNIFYLDNLWDWFDGIYRPYDEIIMTNCVVRPEYLNFQILPQVMKDRALDRLERSNILEGPHHTGRRLVGDSGKTLLRSSLKKNIYGVEKKRNLIKQFCEYNVDLDEIRGTSLAAVAPDLMPLFDAQEIESMLSTELPLHQEGRL